jgi:hypothetical protein
MSAGGWTISPLVAAVLRHKSQPIDMINQSRSCVIHKWTRREELVQWHLRFLFLKISRF